MEPSNQILNICIEKFNSLCNLLNLKQCESRLLNIDSIMSNPTVWNDSQNASKLLKERKNVAESLDIINYFADKISFYKELLSELPEDFNNEYGNLLKLQKEIEIIEFKHMLKDPIYNNPALLTISAGAGGLEAANWVTMLSRMYMRWADINGFNIECLHDQKSDEHSSICTDSITLRIEGKCVYGFLKFENGVHRLIRNSPFNANNARHTSFAAVLVNPDIEDIIDIKIEDKDIEVTAQTSSGSGGQNVNRRHSAIRLRHFPTGINILVRNERDQLANKKIAFKLLKSKLYDIELKKRRSEKDQQIANQMDAKFGSQIRTYTESPYSLVKDHRSEFEINNFDNVLDGNIQELLLENLKIIGNK